MNMKIQCLIVLLCIGTTGWPQGDSILLLDHAQQLEDFRAWKDESAELIESLKSQSRELQMELASLRDSVDALNQSIESTSSRSAKALRLADKNAAALRSVNTELTSYVVEQERVKAELDSEWTQVNNSLDSVGRAISATESSLYKEASRLDGALSTQGKSTTLGFAGAVLLLVVASLAVWRSIQSSSKRTQKSVAEEIDNSNKRMMEQMIEVDQKLAEALTGASVQPSSLDDHSLALKVADEVTRIESNLSQMDTGVRGYKQLNKSVSNVKNNLQAAGYELVEMLGKPYDEGMIAQADFVQDDSLDVGVKIVTRVKRPEVRFNGYAIQTAIITVTHNAN